MFKYKIIQLQGESKIESDLFSCGDVDLYNNTTEYSHLFINCDVQQIVKISLYCHIYHYGEISNDNSKSISINDIPLNLFVKVRY